MSTTAVFAIEIVSSLLFFGLIAWWYAWPRLRSLPLVDALSLLLFVHCFRTVGLSLLVPAAGIDIPARAAQEIGYGDLVSAILAFGSIALLRFKSRAALPLVWLFSVAGMVDLVNAQLVGVQLNLLEHVLGPGWYIVTYFVPLLWVTHVLIVVLLLRRRGELRQLVTARLGHHHPADHQDHDQDADSRLAEALQLNS